MKTIYLVRHGESENNATERYNTSDVGLSPQGEKQILDIADRCVNLQFDCIVSSTMRRARLTAEAIARKVGKEVEFSDLFIERRMPTVLQGRLKTEPEVQQLQKLINDNFHVPGFRYEDGENFDDLKARAIACLTYLAQRPEENILVVTHGFFTNVIAAAVIFGEELTGIECKKILRGVQVVQNTSISVLRLDEKDIHSNSDGIGSRWQLRVWNDHTHLG